MEEELKSWHVYPFLMLFPDDEDITARNFMHVLKTGRFGNRRRRAPKDITIIKTRALFIFGPDNW